MKKYVLDQVVIRREPYFDPGLSTKKSKDSTCAPVDIGSIDDTFATDEEETNSRLGGDEG